jgi:hypothetical protein
MKAKLINTNVNYLLEDDKGVIIASTSTKDGNNKLSKQNCDEIFGVVDVEKLSEEYVLTINDEDQHVDAKLDFIAGYNEAMELNKDKMFTLEDMMNCWNKALKFQDHKETLGEYIQSIQQPTEIEVEIIMRNSRTGNIVKHDSDLEWDEDGLCDRAIPKLDSEGCLILKKI